VFHSLQNHSRPGRRFSIGVAKVVILSAYRNPVSRNKSNFMLTLLNSARFPRRVLTDARVFSQAEPVVAEICDMDSRSYIARFFAMGCPDSGYRNKG